MWLYNRESTLGKAEHVHISNNTKKKVEFLGKFGLNIVRVS